MSSFCRQPFSRPLLMPYLRATSVGVSVDPRFSATISPFCSSVQTRRRSPRVTPQAAPCAHPYDLSYERPQRALGPEPSAAARPWPTSITAKSPARCRRRIAYPGGDKELLYLGPIPTANRGSMHDAGTVQHHPKGA
jgi:hypothetical protein